MQSKLGNMLVLATAMHEGQFDKAGKPYILHCLKVMHYTKSENEDIQCIALGHDLMEDTDVDYKQLRDVFGARIANGIRDLTKFYNEDYEVYKLKVKSNPDAVVVKMADLRHNSDIRRLKGVTEKDIARVTKYHAFYLELLYEMETTYA